MSSSYQQIPLDIPVSQNSSPFHPYSQNFPDESDPESSQLQASLHNPPLPQYHYPPHHFYGQQQPVPINQPGQFYGAPQGFMIAPIDPERRALDMKISDIDKRLNSGWYFAYKVCLYINIVGSALGLLQLSGGLIVVTNLDELKGAPATIFTVVFLIWISWCAWILQHSLVFKNAMSDKNLNGARRGLESMIGFAIYFLLTFICFLVAIEYAKTALPSEMQRESWVPRYVQVFVFLYALPTLLKFFGAKKIIDLLAERETLVAEIKSRYGTNGMINRLKRRLSV